MAASTTSTLMLDTQTIIDPLTHTASHSSSRSSSPQEEPPKQSGIHSASEGISARTDSAAGPREGKSQSPASPHSKAVLGAGSHLSRDMGSKSYTTLLASASPGPSSPFPKLSSDCLQLVSERGNLKEPSCIMENPRKTAGHSSSCGERLKCQRLVPPPTQLGLTKEIRSRKWCSSLAFIYNWKKMLVGWFVF